MTDFKVVDSKTWAKNTANQSKKEHFNTTISSELESQTEVTSTKCFEHQWHLQLKLISMNWSSPVTSLMPFQPFSYWHHIWHTHTHTAICRSYPHDMSSPRASCWNVLKSSCNLFCCAAMLVGLQRMRNQAKSQMLSSVEHRWTPKVFSQLTSTPAQQQLYKSHAVYDIYKQCYKNITTANIINKWGTPEQQQQQQQQPQPAGVGMGVQLEIVH